ncbi:MAG: hypothetical protein GY757_17255 [bacterium]|nr:hypothetical protein [bacterium]
MKPIDNATYEREAREEGFQQGMKIGMKEGLKEGLEEGLEEGKLEAARAFLANGVDIDLIAKALEIPKEKIEAHTPATH